MRIYVRGCKQRGGWSFYTILCTDSTQHSNIRRLSLISIAKAVFWSRLLLSGGTEGLQHQLTLPSSLWWSRSAETEAPGKCGLWNGWCIFVTLNLYSGSCKFQHHVTSSPDCILYVNVNIKYNSCCVSMRGKVYFSQITTFKNFTACNSHNYINRPGWREKLALESG